MSADAPLSVNKMTEKSVLAPKILMLVLKLFPNAPRLHMYLMWIWL